MYDSQTTALIDTLMKDVYTLFRLQNNYESVAIAERDIDARIQYASAVVQSEKVAPLEGWDQFGR